jgi:hypothetical protein
MDCIMVTPPRSQKNTIIPCQGCSLHYPYYIGSLKSKCILQIKYSNTILIHTLSLEQKKRTFSSINYRYGKFQLLKYSHPYYRLLTYNGHLIQHNRLNRSHSLLSVLPNNNTNTLPNHSLINILIENSDIANDLKHLTDLLSPFLNIDFYTDGSYSSDATDNEFFMVDYFQPTRR